MLTSVLEEGEWSFSRYGRFTAASIKQDAQWVPTEGPTVFGEVKNLLSQSELETRIVQPSHYTQSATAAPKGFCYTHETQIRTRIFRVSSQNQIPTIEVQ